MTEISLLKSQGKIGKQETKNLVLHKVRGPPNSLALRVNHFFC